MTSFVFTWATDGDLKPLDLCRTPNWRARVVLYNYSSSIFVILDLRKRLGLPASIIFYDNLPFFFLERIYRCRSYEFDGVNNQVLPSSYRLVRFWFVDSPTNLPGQDEFNTIIGFHAESAEINAQKRYLSTQNKREILTIMWCLHSHYYCWILNIMLFTRISLQWATLGWQIRNCNGSLFNFVDMKVHSVKASLGEGEKKLARWAKLVVLLFLNSINIASFHTCIPMKKKLFKKINCVLIYLMLYNYLLKQNNRVCKVNGSNTTQVLKVERIMILEDTKQMIEIYGFSRAWNWKSYIRNCKKRRVEIFKAFLHDFMAIWSFWEEASIALDRPLFC